jgi:hypothetical protein
MWKGFHMALPESSKSNLASKPHHSTGSGRFYSTARRQGLSSRPGGNRNNRPSKSESDQGLPGWREGDAFETQEGPKSPGVALQLSFKVIGDLLRVSHNRRLSVKVASTCLDSNRWVGGNIAKPIGMISPCGSDEELAPQDIIDQWDNPLPPGASSNGCHQKNGPADQLAEAQGINQSRADLHQAP